ncbi:hypothetical protein R1flu_023246 [Riccia fluitans]|uniref:Uncharacterized protein n=1 Tax=Riccia fluitans TaxID=41844 RepID=A0ABD1XRH8_9MARC
MIKSGQYIPRFRWLTTAKISKLRAERIWRACTSPEFVEVPNVEAIFFGVEIVVRYFKWQDENTIPRNEDAKIETQTQKTSVGRGSDADDDHDADKDGELTRNDPQSRPGHDQQASKMPIVELDEGVKQENPMDHLPEYFRLWD